MPKKPSVKLTKPSKKFIQYSSLGFVTTISLFLIIINVTTVLNKQKVLGVATAQALEAPNRNQLESERQFWLDMVSKNPTYRDGYLEVADIDLQLGNRLEAREMIDKSKQVDPNSEVIADFEKRVSSQY